MTFKGWRFLPRGCGKCCKKGQVLLWRGPYTVFMETIRGYYESLNLTVHDEGTWSGVLDDYGLVFWPLAADLGGGDPSWWSQIVNGSWTGRLVFTAEHSPWTESIAYVNAQSGTTGVGIISASIDPWYPRLPPVEGFPAPTVANPLTAGVESIWMSATSKTSGGTVIAKTLTGAYDWMARNFVDNGLGGTDFVVCGDSNPFDDSLTLVSNNEAFWKNLWDVALDA